MMQVLQCRRSFQLRHRRMAGAHHRWKLRHRRIGGAQRSWKLRLLSCALIFTVNSLATPKPFKAGNKALAEGRFDEAVNLYQEAISEAPESGEIYFNLGNAQYKAGMFEEAMASYEYAASMSESVFMRSRSWYNIGNCMMMTGEAARADDPQAAAACCRQAAWFYRMALDYDAGFEDAAYNLEMSQRILAGIEEEIRQQQEEEQQQNELIQYIREKLEEFIERQAQLKADEQTGEAQRQLEQETRALADVMADSGLTAEVPLPDGSTAPGPLADTHTHTLQAAEAMAVPNQQKALDELVNALGATPADPEQQDGESDEDSDDYDDYDMEYEESDEDADMYEESDPFGDFSEYEEIRGVPPPSQSEMDILAEEVRNQERRKQKKAGEYKAVEKDW